ncbi:MAG: AbrB/MazE/SpoVT family DNA-binding domain-containing protein [Defluviitaleaceae bacterium]|nr:AbrB/MazE/SpoVT family DNA-binding domain-containing protein [Defluviitaleaceae bacterium]
MLSQVSKWGNSQGVRIPKKILNIANIKVDDEVEVRVQNDSIIIMPVRHAKKTLDWYLESYEGDEDRFEWGDGEDCPRGRELL